MEMSRNHTATNTQRTMKDRCKFNARVKTPSDFQRGWRATENCYRHRTLPLRRSRYATLISTAMSCMNKRSPENEIPALSRSMGRSQSLWMTQVSIYVTLFKSTVRYEAALFLEVNTDLTIRLFIVEGLHPR